MRDSERRPPRVLVIHKKTNYQRLVREQDLAHVKGLLAQKDRSVETMERADSDHEGTLQDTARLLEKMGVEAVFRPLDESADASGYDLVITLGGDGALLAASHALGPETPALAINTAPRTSVGYFCAADRAGLEATLRQALDAELAVATLSRMEVEVDGHVISRRVLNDVLFSAASPAETTRYFIHHKGQEEDQKSSGVWIGPAAGSTAAQRSAGGRVMAIGSRKLQFVVREPYRGDRTRYALVRGFVDNGDALTLKNKTQEARLWLDGPYREIPVPLGSSVVLRRSPESLRLLGHRTKTRVESSADGSKP